METSVIKHLAFFDAEFTANSNEDRGVQEMIQCAFLVHQIELLDGKIVHMADEPVFTYTTFLKPTYNKQLSDYIKNLTGINQEDVDSGKSFCSVVDEIYAVIKKYEIKKIITWGPDRQMVRGNCNVINCNLFKARAIYNKIEDVSKKISDLCGYRNIISQHKICEQFGIAEIGEQHNAYCDAKNLSKIIKEFCGQFSL